MSPALQPSSVQRARGAGSAFRSFMSWVAEHPRASAAADGSSSGAMQGVEGFGQKGGEILMVRADDDPPATQSGTPQRARRHGTARGARGPPARASGAVGRGPPRGSRPACGIRSPRPTGPVGRWVRITAVSTLLRFWPPGPDRRVNFLRSNRGASGRAGSRRHANRKMTRRGSDRKGGLALRSFLRTSGSRSSRRPSSPTRRRRGPPSSSWPRWRRRAGRGVRP